MENLENQKSPEKKEKPPFLYHGSPHRGLEEIEPRKTTVRDPEEGELVFATQDIGLASVFMANSRHYGCGRFNETKYCYIVEPGEEFIRRDKGGHIYVLPSDSFETDPNKGLGVYEWTSKQKVKPIEKIEYTSALDAMLANGVQVYFIDEETHKKIEQSPDHGYSILQGLESENQRRGANVREFK